ncbi:retrovirus-related Pol polyprotein from transposon opus [Trichonephila clavipes]|nr:retrovirus-related Pol polyprotein from transposon opus [Trichonephila clavipes]
MKPRFHWVFCQKKAQEHIEDSQRNITSCRNEVGSIGTKDEKVTAEMDKGSMVADSFRSSRSVVPMFSSHMGPKRMTLERIKYSFFFGRVTRANVKKFCESCKECQLTRSVGIKDRSPITPVARPELPFQVVNMDLIGPIDPPSSRDINIFYVWLISTLENLEIYLLLKGEGFVERNSSASWVTVLDLWKWYFCRSLTKNYAACVMSFGTYMTKKVRFKIEYTSYGCNLTAQVLRMLEQFVISRIVDIDLLMQIWKNRVKQINFVLEWERWVGSEIIPAKGKLEP